MKKIVISLIGILLLYPCKSSAASYGSSDTLKVMSYNIRNGKARDKQNSWRFRCPATILMLRDQLPDVFGLQEAFLAQVKYIDKYLPGYDWYGVGRQNGKQQGEIMGIFYNTKRIRLEDKGTIWLSRRPEKPSRGWDAMFRRTATWAVMTQLESGKQFMFVNTHLDHVGKKAREKGLELIVEFIRTKNTGNLPVILTGDFNMEPDDPRLGVLDGELISVREAAEKTDQAPSFNGWGKSQQTIDYIYQKGFRQMAGFKTVTKKYGEWEFVSDHFPISASLLF